MVERAGDGRCRLLRLGFRESRAGWLRDDRRACLGFPNGNIVLKYPVRFSDHG